MRRILFWLHLSAGLAAGTVILVLSATGVLLAYERQLVAWADGSFRSSQIDGVARSGLGQIVADLAAAHPEAPPTMLVVPSDPEAPLTVMLGRDRTVFLDASTGRTLGEGSQRARDFFHGVEDWHRALAFSGESRATGRAVTGAANLLFFFLVLSGACLWWPRKRSASQFLAITTFQGGLRGRARDFNWHNVFGFWAALPLAIVVGTGVVMSYPWANDLLYRLAGSEPPARPAQPGQGGSREAQSRKAFSTPAGLDKLRDGVGALVPDWQTATVRFGAGGSDTLSVGVDRGTEAARPDLRATLALDAVTGDVLRYEPYAAQSRGRQLRTWARFAHTGEAFGVVGQSIALLASAAGVMLVWTGASLSLSRWRAWRARKAAVRSARNRRTDPLEVTS